MAVHSSGSGSGWLEDLDVDQPHGLDQRELNDLRVGIRLRAGQEHTDPADNTAGFIHIPGACAVLAMDITNAVGDPTGNVIADGTYRGHGLAWTYVVQAGANVGLLWCATAAAGASDTGDWTLVKLHPDLQWAGGDVTWAGAHEFDASMDISGNVAMDGDLTIDGKLIVDGDVAIGGDFSVDGTADFGDDVAFVADVSIDASLSVGGNVNFVSDVSIDGTLVMQDAVLTGDSTFTFDAIAGETGPTFKIFGDWSSRVNNTEYIARTDGLVTAFKNTGGAAADIIGLTPAATQRVREKFSAPGSTDVVHIVFPVKNGNTWKVTGATTVYWLPIGDNT